MQYQILPLKKDVELVSMCIYMCCIFGPF